MCEERKLVAPYSTATLQLPVAGIPHPQHCCSAGSGSADVGQQPSDALNCLYVLINTISVQRQDQGAFAGENSLKIIIDKRGGNGWKAGVFLVPVTASVGVSTETPSGPPTS